jgi:hypothetical protein
LGLAPVLDSSKVSDTNAKMDKIEQALTLYVIQNGCLPCPAAPAATVTGQAHDSADYPSECGNAAACAPVSNARSQGPVPWINLGLSRDDVLDAYGNYIDYVLASNGTTGLNLTSISMVRTPPPVPDRAHIERPKLGRHDSNINLCRICADQPRQGQVLRLSSW